MNLLTEAIDNCPVIQPLIVLDWKLNAETKEWQVPIKWDDLFPEDSTWESYQDIMDTYPN
ncbi:hypothetical protein A2U01_0110216, partial [Trifolium medium]|nr:hypothetical protein [Trifolium medium]